MLEQESAAAEQRHSVELRIAQDSMHTSDEQWRARAEKSGKLLRQVLTTLGMTDAAHG